MPRIRVVTPNADPSPDDRRAVTADLQRLTRPGVTLSHTWLERGPRRVQSEADAALATPGVVARSLEAERDGVDTVVIDCTSQPGALEARRQVQIPVIGAGEASLRAARATGQPWAVLEPGELHQDPLGAALRHPDATVLVLGATGHARTAAQLRAALPGVQVIEPLEAALMEAVSLTS